MKRISLVVMALIAVLLIPFAFNNETDGPIPCVSHWYESCESQSELRISVTHQLYHAYYFYKNLVN